MFAWFRRSPKKKSDNPKGTPKPGAPARGVPSNSGGTTDDTFTYLMIQHTATSPANYEASSTSGGDYGSSGSGDFGDSSGSGGSAGCDF